MGEVIGGPDDCMRGLVLSCYGGRSKGSGALSMGRNPAAVLELIIDNVVQVEFCNLRL